MIDTKKGWVILFDYFLENNGKISLILKYLVYSTKFMHTDACQLPVRWIIISMLLDWMK